MLDFSYFVFLQIVSEGFSVSSSGHIMLALEVVKSYNVLLFTAISSIIQINFSFWYGS